MVLPHEIYIDQLALSLGGCPLWGSLHPQVDPVDIGDVGYLSDNGGWIKLFNLRTETDPKDLPSNYQPGSLVITDKDIDRDIFKGPRYSNSVESLGGNLGVQGKAEAGLLYECTEEKGAILFVAEDAVTRDALNKSVFVKLLRDNIQDWVKFATQKGRDVKMDDLILVTGYVRTTTWVAAVFARRSQSCKFTMGGVIPVADTGAKLQLWGSIHNVNAFAWTGGPEEMKTGNPLDTTHFLKHMAPEISPPALLGKDDPRHQCVLVRGYRMAERNWHWREILSFKKKKQLKGIDVLKWNPRNSTGIPDNADRATVPPTITNDAPIADTTTAILNAYTQSLLQLSNLDECLLTSNPDSNPVSDPSSRGRSSNRRGRRTRRGQRRGNDSDRGLNHGNGRRDGGAGAGSSPGGSLGNSGAGLQSGNGGAASNSSESTGTCSSTSQQTSRNVDDDIELEDLFHQWGQSFGACNTGPEMGVVELPSLEGIQNDCESEYSPSDGGDPVEIVLSPWEVLLEYLLRTEEEADYVIVHDDDFSVLPIQPKSVGELEALLQISKPRVYLNGSIGMLKSTALEFFRSTGYFYQTDTEGRVGYFSKSVLLKIPEESAEPLTHTTSTDTSDNHICMFSDYQEYPEILFMALKKIYIHAKTYIHSIRCEYQEPKYKRVLGNMRGNSDDAPPYVFELDSEEYITKIRGRSGEYINQLQFSTNKGRISRLYGGSGGNIFIWTVDEKQYPDSPGLHHFEGTFKKYIQTLQASFPIYPWFEDSRQTMSEDTDLDMFALWDICTIKEICDVVMASYEYTAEIVQCIQVDTILKLLRENTESRSCILLEVTKILEMLKSQEPSTLNCGLMIIAELAKLDKSSFDFVIKNILQITFVRELLMDKERFAILQKLLERGAFKDKMMDLLPVLIGLLTDNNQCVRLNASVTIGYFSEQPDFHTSIQGVIEENQLIDSLQHKEYLVRLTSIILLAKLSEQVRSQPFIIDAFPSIIRLLEDSVSYVRMTAAGAIGKFVEQEGLQPVIRKHITDIIQRLPELLKNRPYEQSGGRITIVKLSQQEDLRGAVLEILPNIFSLCNNEDLSIRANAITLLAELADHAGLTTEILCTLRPDILAPSAFFSPSIWVSVLAVSSTLLDQLKNDKNIDHYMSQLVAMLVDTDEINRDKSAEIVMKLLRYVIEPSVVLEIINLTKSSRIPSCKLNGVNALLTVPEKDSAIYKHIIDYICMIIPDLVEMLRSDSHRERTLAVTALKIISRQPRFQKEVHGINIRIIKVLEENPRSQAICPGIEIFHIIQLYAKERAVIETRDIYLKVLSTLLDETSDKSAVLASLSLAIKVLSADTLSPSGMATLPVVRAVFELGDPDINHRGIMILLSLCQGDRKNRVITMIKELIFHIADSSKAESIRDLSLPKLHIDGSDNLIGQLFEQGKFHFQSVILEAIPMFVEAAKHPGNESAYNILKMLSVQRELQSAIQPAILPVVEKIESNTEYLEACLGLLWTLSEQAAYRSAIMSFAPRLASMMRDNTRPDVQVTMAGVLMNLRTLPSGTKK